MGEQTNRHAYRWWHGFLFYAGVQAAVWGIRMATRQIAGRRGRQADRDFYRRKKLPVFAPPGVAFPIAWTVNSAGSIASALRVLNLERHSEERSRFLALQGAAWLLFVLFSTAYFELRSPVNSAAITLAYSGVTVASLRSALRMKNWPAALALLPTAAWLALAVPVGITVAAWNRDEFWKVGPFLHPPRYLLK
jgi:tryptophan-rich sensory protein